MEKKHYAKKMLANIVILLLLIFATFRILLKGNDISDIFNVIKSVNLGYLILGLAVSFTFVLCEALNIKILLKVLGSRTKYLKCIKYSIVGFFFSSITPSATGGQPMQVYYMAKDKISPSKASLSILIELFSFQLISVIACAIALIINSYKHMFNIGMIRYLIYVGMFVNTIILLFIMLSIFSKRFVRGVSKFLKFINRKLTFISIKKRNKIDKSIGLHLQEYANSSIVMKNNLRVMLRVVVVSFAQVFFLYSIPYVVYLAFNLKGITFIEMWLLQAMLTTAVSFIPLPGAVGANESSFLALYKTIFPSQLLSSAMILNRAFSFYSLVIICGATILILQLRNCIFRRS